MGFFGRLLGVEPSAPQRHSSRSESGFSPAQSSEERAIEQYRYMLRTAPPESIEAAHAEAFAKLTPEQRQRVLGELVSAAPPGERSAAEATSLDDPRALARVATRAETRSPGTVERALGSGAMGFGAGLLGSFAMGFAGSMVAQAFFSALPDFGGEATEGEALAQAEDDTGQSGEDPYLDDGADFGEDYEV